MRPNGNLEKHQGNSFGYVQKLHLRIGQFLVREKGPLDKLDLNW